MGYFAEATIDEEAKLIPQGYGRSAKSYGLLYQPVPDRRLEGDMPYQEWNTREKYKGSS